jgi:hypothetical protein
MLKLIKWAIHRQFFQFCSFWQRSKNLKMLLVSNEIIGAMGFIVELSCGNRDGKIELKESTTDPD